MKVSGMYTIECLILLPHLLLGIVSDGEFNYLCMKGYTRPLSVLQIRADVCRKYSRLSSKKLLAMLTPNSKSLCITMH